MKVVRCEGHAARIPLSKPTTLRRLAGTVFAYGATGAGKTYTMSGHEQILRSGSGSKGARHRGKAAVRGKVPGNSNGGGEGGSTDGLIPRSMRFLFQRIAALRSGVTMRVRASFYEIYNEVVYDLLAQGERRPLQVWRIVIGWF